MSDILYFDAFTCIGPRIDKHPAEAWKLEDLLAEMNHCSISGALVNSTQSVHYDATYGNLPLSEAIVTISSSQIPNRSASVGLISASAAG